MAQRPQGTERVNGRNYEVWEVLSRKNGLRLRVSYRGKRFALLILPAGSRACQHVQALSRLSEDNRNYPRVLEVEHRGEEIRILTSWIEGRSLQWYLDRGRAEKPQWPSLSQTVKLVRGLAHALYCVHRANLFHTDLKPANLILARQPDRLVVIDFGSAILAERATRWVEGDGVTPAYAAPEVWTETPDFRADLFSLSVIAFEMLTGKLPYEDIGGKIGHPQFRTDETPPCEKPSASLFHSVRYPRRVLKLLDAVVTGGLSLDRAKRYPSSAEFREAWSQVFKAVEQSETPTVLDRILKWFHPKR